MGYQFTIIDGNRVEVHVAAAFRRMAAAFLRETGCQLLVRDGTRTDSEQQAEYDAYVRRGFSPPRVAYPGTSNHQESGPSGPRSLDLYDSGDDPGVKVFGTDRDAWMQVNGPRFGFENEGNNFNEAWHKTYRGSLTEPLPDDSAPAPVQTLHEEDDMTIIQIDCGPRGKHIAAIGPKTFRHFIGDDPLTANCNVFNGGKPPMVVLQKELPSLLRTAGCDLNIWDLRQDSAGVWQFVVLDPLTGVAASGNVWTAENATRAALGKAQAR